MLKNQDTIFILHQLLLKNIQDFIWFVADLINLEMLFDAIHFANFILTVIIENIELMVFIFINIIKNNFEELIIFHIIIVSNGLSLLNIKQAYVVENSDYDPALDWEETTDLEHASSPSLTPHH